MKRVILILLAISLMLANPVQAIKGIKKDVLRTSEGNLEINVLGHASLMFKFNGDNIYVDPTSGVIDIKHLPKADLILLTHEHYDHFDRNAIDEISKSGTLIVYTKECAKKMPDGIVMKNNDQRSVLGIVIKAIPAYNIHNKDEKGKPFHPKGDGNGYLLRFGDKNIYVAGDTEFIPEMKDLMDIDVAFLPYLSPYTMDEEMFADAVKVIQPKILYPYSCGNNNPLILGEYLASEEHIEMRIR